MKPSLKRISGILLILIAFIMIGSLAFPALTDSSTPGRVEKHQRVSFSFLKQERSKLLLVYFGYVGCTQVCEPALNDLAQISRLVKKEGFRDIPTVWFVNMTPQMDASSVQSWAKHFDNSFKSYTPNAIELSEMVGTLNLIYTPLGPKAEHMPYIYLMKKTDSGYELVYIYTSLPYNRALILKDIGALQ